MARSHPLSILRRREGILTKQYLSTGVPQCIISHHFTTSGSWNNLGPVIYVNVNWHKHFQQRLWRFWSPRRTRSQAHQSRCLGTARAMCQRAYGVHLDWTQIRIFQDSICSAIETPLKRSILCLLEIKMEYTMAAFLCFIENCTHYSTHVTSRRVNYWKKLTTGQEVACLFHDGFGQLLCALQVLEDVDVGGQECHVLLPTPIRHLKHPIKVLQGSAHNVTWTYTPSEINNTIKVCRQMCPWLGWKAVPP